MLFPSSKSFLQQGLTCFFYQASQFLRPLCFSSFSHNLWWVQDGSNRSHLYRVYLFGFLLVGLDIWLWWFLPLIMYDPYIFCFDSFFLINSHNESIVSGSCCSHHPKVRMQCYELCTVIIKQRFFLSEKKISLENSQKIYLSFSDKFENFTRRLSKIPRRYS